MENGEIKKNANSLSVFETWAFSIGTAIGWGSLVVTANTYLAKAGPVGSVLGLIIGAVVMLIMSRNYYYLMEIHPDGGGAYTYVKEQFGYDHGFLTAWFLSLVYLAILWANATAIPLFMRNFVGDMFMVGRMYTLFGYNVYFGETAFSKLKGNNKELFIVKGANHVDLYDGGDKNAIPFDKIESFYKENLK